MTTATIALEDFESDMTVAHHLERARLQRHFSVDVRRLHEREAAAYFAMAERGRALVLIGFMGTGKSSAGRAVAHRLQVARFDTDEIISARFGLPVAEIFARFGEVEFREAEIAALAELNGAAPAVIVTGGGIVLRPENVERMQQLGAIVHLFANEETIFARVSRRPTRPLLQTDNPRATLSLLLQEREPLYRPLADFELDTSTLSHEEVADELINFWEAGTLSRMQ